MVTEELTRYGLKNVRRVFHNLSYKTLYEHETFENRLGYEITKQTSMGAISVDTGKYTGRSPDDKFVVNTPEVSKKIWWSHDGSDNNPMEIKTWNHLKRLAINQLSNKNIYVMDGFCGSNIKTRLSVRLVAEVAWIAHFFKNMFIRPTKNDLNYFAPDWTILHVCKTSCKDYKTWGLNSESFIVFNINERILLIGGTWYSGEIKKGMFSIMNYFLPLQGVGSFHCSANCDHNGNNVTLFFGLSGTGKTTLSTDPSRKLIGDDEHSWDEYGVGNLEGGCYAKVANLSKLHEPEIYRAIKRDAILENVVVNDGIVDFKSTSKTENTRVSYPIHHIKNAIQPISMAGHPKTIIFLTCDVYGVLPPVSKLSTNQAIYQFLSGYTAKVSGTELGVREPSSIFSSCFGQPFLLLNPLAYAEILSAKIRANNTKTYLVNTGWISGGYKNGKRISIQDTRVIVRAILNGLIDTSELIQDTVFGFWVPKEIKGIDDCILDPGSTWSSRTSYYSQYKKLAQMFIENFKKFENSVAGKKYKQYGPVV